MLITLRSINAALAIALAIASCWIRAALAIASCLIRAVYPRCLFYRFILRTNFCRFLFWQFISLQGCPTIYLWYSGCTQTERTAILSFIIGYCLVPLIFFILAYNAIQRGNSPVVSFAIGAVLAIGSSIGQAITGSFGIHNIVVIIMTVVFAIIIFVVKR